MSQHVFDIFSGFQIYNGAFTSDGVSQLQQGTHLAYQKVRTRLRTHNIHTSAQR